MFSWTLSTHRCGITPASPAPQECFGTTQAGCLHFQVVDLLIKQRLALSRIAYADERHAAERVL